MDGTDFSGLIAKAVAGLDEVRACLLVSRDGLTLGAYPQGGEDRAREAWNRLSSVGDPERGFLVMSDEVWVFARRGAYACVVVGSASAKAGLLLDRMEATLRAAEEARLQAGSVTSSPPVGRRPRPALHRDARSEPEPADQVLEEVAKVLRVPEETAAPEASVAPPAPPPVLPAAPPPVPLEAPPEPMPPEPPVMPPAEPPTPVVEQPPTPQPPPEPAPQAVEPPLPAAEPRMVDETMIEPPVVAEPVPPAPEPVRPGPEGPLFDAFETMPEVEIMPPEPELEEPVAPQAAVVELPDVEIQAPYEPVVEHEAEPHHNGHRPAADEPSVAADTPIISFPGPAAPGVEPEDDDGSLADHDVPVEPLAGDSADAVPAAGEPSPVIDDDVPSAEAEPMPADLPTPATPEPSISAEGPRYTPPATLLGEAAFMGAAEPERSGEVLPDATDHPETTEDTAEADAPAPTAGLHAPPSTEDGDVDAAALAREFAQLFDEPNEL